MSISLGIYDLFSYLIPGMLYLYVVNAFLQLVNWQFFELATVDQQPDIIWPILLLVGAYLFGHFFETLRDLLLDRRFYYGTPEKALEKVRSRLSHSGVKLDFQSNEWAIYLEVLRQRRAEATRELERYLANSLMMKNLSLGLFLFAVLELSTFIMQTRDLKYILFMAAGGLASYILYRRALRFDEWTYRAIFAQALAYGTSLKEFLKNIDPSWKNDRSAKTVRKVNSLDRSK